METATQLQDEGADIVPTTRQVEWGTNTMPSRGTITVGVKLTDEKDESNQIEFQAELLILDNQCRWSTLS